MAYWENVRIKAVVLRTGKALRVSTSQRSKVGMVAIILRNLLKLSNSSSSSQKIALRAVYSAELAFARLEQVTFSLRREAGELSRQNVGHLGKIDRSRPLRQFLRRRRGIAARLDR
jgi:hypothetical protein